MAIILKIIDHIQVVIGMDDHSTITVSRNELNFQIHETMLIDVHEYNNQYIFSPADQSNENQMDNMALSNESKTIFVNKITYGVLYIFFGGWGIHEFYAGNPKKGFLWIFASLTIFLTTILPIFINLSHHLYGMQSHLEGILMLLLPALIYNFSILILAIIALCKQTNNNGEILVSKW